MTSPTKQKEKFNAKDYSSTDLELIQTHCEIELNMRAYGTPTKPKGGDNKW